MSTKERIDPKRDTLRRQRVLNPYPQRVADPLFVEDEFFDARDLVQVRYEMLRRVQVEGHSVTGSCGAFGVSRPGFYQAQRAFRGGGLLGLVPQKRGPRHPHKLTAEIMNFLKEAVEEDQSLRPKELSVRVQRQFGVLIHPRTIERGMSPRKKNRSRRRKDRRSV